METNSIDTGKMTAEGILRLSQEKFEWKTSGQFDKLAGLFDDDLIFIHLTGRTTTKENWINQLKTGQFKYNLIVQKEASVRIYGDTAVLVGKASFTVNGGNVYHLVYTEVYTLKNDEIKLVNLHASSAY